MSESCYSEALVSLASLVPGRDRNLDLKDGDRHCLPPSEQEGVHVILFILCSYLFKFVYTCWSPVTLFVCICLKAIVQSKKVRQCHVMSTRRQFTQQFGHRKAPWPQRTSASSRARSLHRFVVFFCFFAFSQTERYDEIQVKISENWNIHTQHEAPTNWSKSIEIGGLCSVGRSNQDSSQWVCKQWGLNCGFLSRCWSVSPSMSFLSFYAFLSSSFFVGTCMIFHIYMFAVALCYAAFACLWKVALKEAKAGKASADFALKTLRLGTLSLGGRLKQLCTTKTLSILQHLNTKFLIAYRATGGLF